MGSGITLKRAEALWAALSTLSAERRRAFMSSSHAVKRSGFPMGKATVGCTVDYMGSYNPEEEFVALG